MDEREIVHRIRRIHAALGATVEQDLDKLEARFISTENVRSVVQDFSGGLSPADLENLAYSLIHNVASLHDHLRRCAAGDERAQGLLDAAFNGTVALRIVKDLSNRDKHGPSRDGGHSGLAPRLDGVKRSLRLTVPPGSSIEVTLGPRGTPQLSGGGSAKAILTGDVLDKDGSLVGELNDIVTNAIAAWESLVRDLGLNLDGT